MLIFCKGYNHCTQHGRSSSKMNTSICILNTLAPLLKTRIISLVVVEANSCRSIVSCALVVFVSKVSGRFLTHSLLSSCMSVLPFSWCRPTTLAFHCHLGQCSGRCQSCSLLGPGRPSCLDTKKRCKLGRCFLFGEPPHANPPLFYPPRCRWSWMPSQCDSERTSSRACTMRPRMQQTRCKRNIERERVAKHGR